jgi:DnaJ-domain-containing protein 1
MYDTQKITKTKLEVEVRLDDGEVMTGSLFVSPQGRLSDMMNDERRFLPFERSDGTFLMLKKDACRSVTPLAAAAPKYEGNNPFRILGLDEGADAEAVKQAYRAACAANHPDRLAGTGLAKDYLDMANARMARINDAYRRIMKRYETAAAS